MTAGALPSGPTLPLATSPLDFHMSLLPQVSVLPSLPKTHKHSAATLKLPSRILSSHILHFAPQQQPPVKRRKRDTFGGATAAGLYYQQQDGSKEARTMVFCAGDVGGKPVDKSTKEEILRAVVDVLVPPVLPAYDAFDPEPARESRMEQRAPVEDGEGPREDSDSDSDLDLEDLGPVHHHAANRETIEVHYDSLGRRRSSGTYSPFSLRPPPARSVQQSQNTSASTSPIPFADRDSQSFEVGSLHSARLLHISRSQAEPQSAHSESEMDGEIHFDEKFRDSAYLSAAAASPRDFLLPPTPQPPIMQNPLANSSKESLLDPEYHFQRSPTNTASQQASIASVSESRSMEQGPQHSMRPRSCSLDRRRQCLGKVLIVYLSATAADNKNASSTSNVAQTRLSAANHRASVWGLPRLSSDGELRLSANADNDPNDLLEDDLDVEMKVVPLRTSVGRSRAARGVQDEIRKAVWEWCEKYAKEEDLQSEYGDVDAIVSAEEEDQSEAPEQTDVGLHPGAGKLAWSRILSTTVPDLILAVISNTATAQLEKDLLHQLSIHSPTHLALPFLLPSVVTLPPSPLPSLERYLAHHPSTRFLILTLSPSSLPSLANLQAALAPTPAINSSLPSSPVALRIVDLRNYMGTVSGIQTVLEGVRRELSSRRTDSVAPPHTASTVAGVGLGTLPITPIGDPSTPTAGPAGRPSISLQIPPTSIQPAAQVATPGSCITDMTPFTPAKATAGLTPITRLRPALFGRQNAAAAPKKEEWEQVQLPPFPETPSTVAMEDLVSGKPKSNGVAVTSNSENPANGAQDVKRRAQSQVLRQRLAEGGYLSLSFDSSSDDEIDAGQSGIPPIPENPHSKFENLTIATNFPPPHSSTSPVSPITPHDRANIREFSPVSPKDATRSYTITGTVGFGRGTPTQVSSSHTGILRKTGSGPMRIQHEHHQHQPPRSSPLVSTGKDFSTIEEKIVVPDNEAERYTHPRSAGAAGSNSATSGVMGQVTVIRSGHTHTGSTSTNNSKSYGGAPPEYSPQQTHMDPHYVRQRNPEHHHHHHHHHHTIKLKPSGSISSWFRRRKERSESPTAMEIHGGGSGGGLGRKDEKWDFRVQTLPVGEEGKAKWVLGLQ